MNNTKYFKALDIKETSEQDRFAKVDALIDAGGIETANLIKLLAIEGPNQPVSFIDLMKFLEEYRLAQCDLYEGPCKEITLSNA